MFIGILRSPLFDISLKYIVFPNAACGVLVLAILHLPLLVYRAILPRRKDQVTFNYI